MRDTEDREAAAVGGKELAGPVAETVLAPCLGDAGRGGFSKKSFTTDAEEAARDWPPGASGSKGRNGRRGASRVEVFLHPANRIPATARPRIEPLRIVEGPGQVSCLGFSQSTDVAGFCLKVGEAGERGAELKDEASVRRALRGVRSRSGFVTRMSDWAGS